MRELLALEFHSPELADLCSDPARRLWQEPQSESAILRIAKEHGTTRQNDGSRHLGRCVERHIRWARVEQTRRLSDDLNHAAHRH
jgi:hypothetical protein